MQWRMLLGKQGLFVPAECINLHDLPKTALKMLKDFLFNFLILWFMNFVSSLVLRYLLVYQGLILKFSYKWTIFPKDLYFPTFMLPTRKMHSVMCVLFSGMSERWFSLLLSHGEILDRVQERWSELHILFSCVIFSTFLHFLDHTLGFLNIIPLVNGTISCQVENSRLIFLNNRKLYI